MVYHKKPRMRFRARQGVSGECIVAHFDNWGRFLRESSFVQKLPPAWIGRNFAKNFS
jgi:hypothetical protein